MIFRYIKAYGSKIKEARLADFALVAEIISAIAIILSLFFVGTQISENSRATRSATANASVASISEWYAGMGQSEVASANFLNAMTDPDSLSREEWFQFVMNFHAAMLNFQNSFYLVEEGTLDTEIRDSLVAVIAAVKDQPGFHRYWEQRRAIFFPEFQNFVDGIVASELKNSEGLYRARNEGATDR